MKNIGKRIARNIRNGLGLNSVVGAGGGKGGKSAGGDVSLKPPETTDLLQSISYMQSLDLICKGPIHGPVKRNGADAKGLDILESVYYNNNPIKEPSTSNFNQKNLKFENVQFVDRLNTTSLGNAIDNINANFGEDVVSDNLKVSVLEAINKNETFFANFGMMQFNSSGVFAPFMSTNLL